MDASPKTLPPSNTSDERLADIRELIAATGCSRAWILREVKAGRFPAPVIRRHKCVRWRMSQVIAWMDNFGTAASAAPVGSA